MRLIELHTAPLWQELDGQRTIGLHERPDHPPVIGWVNAALLKLQDTEYWLLLTNTDR